MFSRFLRPAIGITLGAGATYLTQQLVDYKKLQKGLETDIPEVPLSNEKVPAKAKEWLIIGRQSPGYVRDVGKTPKDQKYSIIDSSALYMKKLGTVMDNEKHYNLFEGSDFEVQMFSSDTDRPRVVVPPEKMLSTNIEEIDDDTLFEVGFARKQGFVDITKRSPLYHSSIGLRVVSAENPASPDACLMTGAEIKTVVGNTEERICRRQHCTLYESNCYSASTFAMGEMIRVIDSRDSDDSAIAEDISKIMPVLKSATTDNLSRGVSNNAAVRVQLESDVHSVLVKRELTAKSPETSAAEQAATRKIKPLVTSPSTNDTMSKTIKAKEVVKQMTENVDPAQNDNSDNRKPGM